MVLLPQCLLASSLHRSAHHSPTRLFTTFLLSSFHPRRSSAFYYTPISPPPNASRRFRCLLPALRIPPFEGFGGRSYRTANAEVVVGEEPSCHVEEGMLEAKQQEADSLRSSMEELNKEIEKLKELQKQKLAQLEKLEEEVDEKKIDSHAAPSEFRAKKETNNATPSSVAPSAAETEVVKQMTLETLGITEELDDEQKTGKLKTKRRVKKEVEHSEMVDEKLVKAEDGELKKSKSNSSSSSSFSYARKRGTSSEERVETDDAQEVKHSPEKIRQVTLEVSEIVAGSNRKLPAKKLPFSASDKRLTENKSTVASESRVSYSGSSTRSNEVTTIGEQSGLATELGSGHPWPEWVAFLEHLETNDYFEDDQQGVSGRGDVFNDESSVKHAVNRFGRDRDDIFRFLSKKDMKVIANFGCPNTDRKAVNCAKRLRVLCNITEGEVCQECRLKKSCARAFNQAASDVVAGTLDVVRVLFPYAVNVLPSSKSHESYPEDLNTSVCNLLKQLVQLSANPRDPNIPKPKPPPVVKKIVNHERAVQDSGDSFAGAAYDDWTCTDCDFANFGRNKFCRRCGVYRPSIELKAGDWECPNLRCRFSNFAKNTACLKCETARPARVERTEGEWHEGSRRLKFQEDYNGSWGRADKSTSRPHSRWKDGHSSRERGNTMMTLDSRGGTQRYKHEEWKPDLRRELSDDDEDGDFANSDESEEDATTSNLDTGDEQKLDDDEESSNEEDKEWGLAKGVKTSKLSITRSFDTSDDDDNDLEPDRGNDRRRRTDRTTQVTDWRNEAKGRHVNRDQDNFRNRDPDGGGYRSTLRGSNRDGRSNGRNDTKRESFGNRDPDGGGYRSTSRGSFRNGRSNGRKDTERRRSTSWKR